MAASGPSYVAHATTTAYNSNEEVEEIVVEGAGTTEVNGIINRRQSYRGLPSWWTREHLVFSKSGSWKGMEVNFFIYQSTAYEHWYNEASTGVMNYPPQMIGLRWEKGGIQHLNGSGRIRIQ